MGEPWPKDAHPYLGLAKEIQKTAQDETHKKPSFERCFWLAKAWTDARNEAFDWDVNGMVPSAKFGTEYNVTREIAAAHLFASNEAYLYERADEMRVEPIK